MAVNKTVPISFLPIPAHRDTYNYNFLPAKLRGNPPAPKVKNPVVLEADAVLVDLNSTDWLSRKEFAPVHPINTVYPNPSLEAHFQLPPYLQRTFMEAYRLQSAPQPDRPSKGVWVNLTA